MDVAEMTKGIRERIEYPAVLSHHSSSKGTVDAMVSILLEVELANAETYQISGAEYPAELVKARMAAVDGECVEYVLERLKGTGRIRNIKQYLLASLFNAPATIGGSCEAEVRHDMPWIMQG